MGRSSSSSSCSMMSCFFRCYGSPKAITDGIQADDSHHHHTSSFSFSPPPRQQLEKEVGVKRFSWEEIQRFTANFSQVIGVGGFSTVYLARGCLVPGGATTTAAVKIYNYSSERLNRVFRNELEICTQLYHPNIVKLLGYCDERDEGVLVFEYVKSGDLQEILHTKQKQETTNIILPWKTRMTIAFQLAQSLHHLHEECSPHIVHGDIKSSNILLHHHHHLNTSTSPPPPPLLKLCDFGSSKKGFSSTITPTSSSSSSSSSSASSSASRTAMLGSPGYVDPHYLMTGIISKKSDIYSLGVIILELITGLEAYSSEKEQLLTALVRKRTSGGRDDGGSYSSSSSSSSSVTGGTFDVEKVVNELVDSRLKGISCTMLLDDEEEVRAMAVVAGMCLHQMPSLRPTAAEICQVMRESIASIQSSSYSSSSSSSSKTQPL